MIIAEISHEHRHPNTFSQYCDGQQVGLADDGACQDNLRRVGVANESLVVSAHRTPDWMSEFAKGARQKGVKIIIAGAGGAAHLPGMIASMTTLPVLGVPIKSKALDGIDSLLSIAQMPAGVPVGTLAIGDAGAKNAALLAIRILGLTDESLLKATEEFQAKQTTKVLENKKL